MVDYSHNTHPRKTTELNTSHTHSTISDYQRNKQARKQSNICIKMKDNPKKHSIDPSDDGPRCDQQEEKQKKKRKKKKIVVSASKKNESSLVKSRHLYESAKQKWLYPDEDSDYEVEVKKSLRKSISALENDNDNNTGTDDIKGEQDQEEKYSLLAQANDALTLLCIQKSEYNPKEVFRLLRGGGYVARLSQDVLRYKLPSDVINSDQPKVQHSTTALACPCRLYDDALPKEDLNVLINALCPEDSSYWKDHSYSVYPPTPYFSYAFDLKDDTLKKLGALGKYVQTIQRLSSNLPSKGRESKKRIPQYAEVWAHHRPHCSGHQLHFDSDNEGRGEVKHPLVSSILYLSEEGCGGPSLMTDQRLGDTELAQNGWLAYPKRNRLVVFDGSVLHGVIPGRGYVGQRKRVTLMVALWEDIRIREGDEPGAARPLPRVNQQTKSAPIPEWYDKLTLTTQDGKQKGKSTNPTTEGLQHVPDQVEPIRLGSVFTTSSGKQIKEGRMPHYDTVFQGF